MVVRPYFGLGLMMAFLERVCMGCLFMVEGIDVWGRWWECVRGWEDD